MSRPRALALIERSLRRALAVVEASDTTTESAAASPVLPEPTAEQPLEPPDSPASETVVPAQAIDPASFTRELRPGHLTIERASVTNALFERLAEEDVAEVEDRIGDSAELSADYAYSSSERVRRHLVLSFGVHLGDPGVLAKTGLSQGEP